MQALTTEPVLRSAFRIPPGQHSSSRFPKISAKAVAMRFRTIFGSFISIFLEMTIFRPSVKLIFNSIEMRTAYVSGVSYTYVFLVCSDDARSAPSRTLPPTPRSRPLPPPPRRISYDFRDSVNFVPFVNFRRAPSVVHMSDVRELRRPCQGEHWAIRYRPLRISRSWRQVRQLPGSLRLAPRLSLLSFRPPGLLFPARSATGRPSGAKAHAFAPRFF